MALKGGEIEVDARRRVSPRETASHPIPRDDMGRTGKKNSELPGKDDGKPKKPPVKPVEDDDFEDGDFATPKRDRQDDDNQPL
jgi:hypothetical protein